VRRTMAIMTAAGLLLSGGCETGESARSSDEPAMEQTAAMSEGASGEGESMQIAMTRDEPITMAEVARRAESFDTILATPTFERTAAQIGASSQFAMNDADRELDLIGALAPDEVTFDTTVGAIDDVANEVNKTVYRHYLIRETSPEAVLRDAARESTVAISNWFVETQYREDLYRAVRAYADRLERGEVPPLAGEDRLLFEETMRDYRRAGLHLDKATRDRVAALQKELTEITTEFSANNSAADVPLVFTRAELEGVPETFLDAWRTGPDAYTVKATVTPQFVTVMSNAEREETRRRMKTARYSVNQEENAPLLNEMVRIRDEMAQLLGYETWADYRTETRMAGTGATAERFVADLARGLEPKFREEMATLASMKASDTGQEDATIHVWDWRYYSNKLLRERYDVDVEALRNYFPLERVIAGAFDIYGEVFGLTFEPVTSAPPPRLPAVLPTRLPPLTWLPLPVTYMPPPRPEVAALSSTTFPESVAFDELSTSPPPLLPDTLPVTRLSSKEPPEMLSHAPPPSELVASLSVKSFWLTSGELVLKYAPPPRDDAVLPSSSLSRISTSLPPLTYIPPPLLAVLPTATLSSITALVDDCTNIPPPLDASLPPKALPSMVADEESTYSPPPLPAASFPVKSQPSTSTASASTNRPAPLEPVQSSKVHSVIACPDPPVRCTPPPVDTPLHRRKVEDSSRRGGDPVMFARMPARAESRIVTCAIHGRLCCRVTEPVPLPPPPANSMTQCSRTEPERYGPPGPSKTASSASGVKVIAFQSPAAGTSGADTLLVKTIGSARVPRATSVPPPKPSDPTEMPRPGSTRTSTPGSMVSVASTPTRTELVTT